MKKLVTLVLFLTLGGVALTACTTGGEADMPRIVKKRSLPVPAAASDAVQHAISVSPLPYVEVLGQEPPQTKDGWLKLQQESNVNALDEFAELMNVNVSKDIVEGVYVYRVTPKRPSVEFASIVFVHLHPGGYVLTGGDAAPNEAALIAGALGIEAISVDYRMPPEHPFPAAIDDVVTVYQSILKDRSASTVLLGGTSAGGGLALSSVHKLIALGVQVPGAIWVGTPWADLTKTGDSLYTNDGIDRVVMSYDGMMAGMALLYAGGQNLEHPLISPVYGDFTGFPPVQLVTGTRDLFLSDTVRTHRKLRSAGAIADLNVYEGFSHAEYLMVPESAETQQILADLSRFLRNHYN